MTEMRRNGDCGYEIFIGEPNAVHIRRVTLDAYGAPHAEEDAVTEREFPEFRWLERGEGEPMLLLHGLMGRMEHWDIPLDLLADRCRPIAPALPIFDPHLAEASIAELARWVTSFMDALEIPQAVVGGNSLGGHVALAMALDHPERVSGLVLTGSSGLFERGFTRGVPHRPTSEYIRQKMGEVFHNPVIVTPEWVESVRRTVTEPPTAMRVLRFARAAKRHNIEARLAEIRVPTLLVWGREDRITPPAVAERLDALIPDARLVVLPECGHTPMLEHPHVWSLIVRGWLATTRSRRARVVAAAGTGG
jgi:pimeloyl-ACP methyl ester carboxylesterase